MIRLFMVIGLLLAPLIVNAQTLADPRPAGDAAARVRPLTNIFQKSPVDLFRAAVSKSQNMAVYEGIPDPASESLLYTAESKRQDLLRFGKSAFYPKPINVSPGDREKIISLFQSGGAFSAGNNTPCGTFHADYLVVFTSEGEEWHAEIGLGCQEIRASGPGVCLNRYIPPSAYGQLMVSIGKYRVTRPSAGAERDNGPVLLQDRADN